MENKYLNTHLKHLLSVEVVLYKLKQNRIRMCQIIQFCF